MQHFFHRHFLKPVVNFLLNYLIFLFTCLLLANSSSFEIFPPLYRPKKLDMNHALLFLPFPGAELLMILLLTKMLLLLILEPLLRVVLSTLLTILD